MSYATVDLTPTPADKFTFGLWTVGWQARDPFGDPTREPMDPVLAAEKLGELGAYGVTLHDDDLLSPLLTGDEREAAISRFEKAVDAAGLKIPMITTNLFSHPVFKDGAFTSNSREVRRYALAKVRRNLDLAARFGATTYVLWGGREGSESDAAKDVQAALDRYAEGLDSLCDYIVSQGYDIRLAIEPKPNEPRGDILLPTIGHALGLIDRLDHSDMVGLNPEVGHEQMAGLNMVHGVAQALWAGKLFHIDLNSQRMSRYDQDFRFGQEDLKEAFLLVRLLEGAGYTGPRHFDAHALRVEDAAGVEEFARGCMRTYLILAEKARAFDADPRVAEALAAAQVPELAQPTVGPYSPQAAQALADEAFDVDAIAARGAGHERVDQLVVECLMGV